jgi:hypothetical protein
MLQGCHRGMRPLSMIPASTVEGDGVDSDCTGGGGILGTLALAIAAELPRNRLRISSCDEPYVN